MSHGLQTQDVSQPSLAFPTIYFAVIFCTIAP